MSHVVIPIRNGRFCRVNCLIDETWHEERVDFFKTYSTIESQSHKP